MSEYNAFMTFWLLLSELWGKKLKAVKSLKTFCSIKEREKWRNSWNISGKSSVFGSALRQKSVQTKENYLAFVINWDVK